MDRPIGRPARAADVAALAGVSRATVSHVFNGRAHKFPQPTIDKVRAAAKALDYRPSPAGKSLVTGRSNTVVILVPGTELGPPLQRAVDRIISGSGVNVVVRFADPDPESTVDALLQMRPLAVVNMGPLGPAHCERLAAQGIPSVPDVRESRVRADRRKVHEAIADIQVAELVRAGADRIVFVCPDDMHVDLLAVPRLHGLAAACEALGISAPARVDLPEDLDEAGMLVASRKGAGRLGVCAYNDMVAFRVLAAARRVGLRVPADLAVVGVDALEVGRLWDPPLTSVCIDVAGLMDDVLDQLGELLHRRERPVRERRGELVTLVAGGTT